MRFYLEDTKETKEITVKSWADTGYGPDCFYDLEVNFPKDHKMIEDDGAYICTSEEYKELVRWWSDEVEAMKNGELGAGGDYTECPDEDIEIFAN